MDGEASQQASVIFESTPCVGQYLTDKESTEYALIHYEGAQDRSVDFDMLLVRSACLVLPMCSFAYYFDHLINITETPHRCNVSFADSVSLKYVAKPDGKCEEVAGDYSRWVCQCHAHA